MKIRTATESDRPRISRLLDAAELPSEDFARYLDDFLVAEDEGEVIGAIGIERSCEVGLLRSLVVAPSARQRGAGSSLCASLVAAARARGVRELFLLTTTAERFFADRGFAPVDRQSAPQAIRATEEYSTLCPENATLMHRNL